MILPAVMLLSLSSCKAAVLYTDPYWPHLVRPKFSLRKLRFRALSRGIFLKIRKVSDPVAFSEEALPASGNLILTPGLYRNDPKSFLKEGESRPSRNPRRRIFLLNPPGGGREGFIIIESRRLEAYREAARSGLRFLRRHPQEKARVAAAFLLSSRAREREWEAFKDVFRQEKAESSLRFVLLRRREEFSEAENFLKEQEKDPAPLFTVLSLSFLNARLAERGREIKGNTDQNPDRLLLTEAQETPLLQNPFIDYALADDYPAMLDMLFRLIRQKNPPSREEVPAVLLRQKKKPRKKS